MFCKREDKDTENRSTATLVLEQEEWEIFISSFNYVNFHSQFGIKGIACSATECILTRHFSAGLWGVCVCVCLCMWREGESSFHRPREIAYSKLVIIEDEKP